jgi:hypothetical protein
MAKPAVGRRVKREYFIAQMAKLVDALCSGRSVRKDVLVRIQFWAQMPSTIVEGIFHLGAL